MSLSPGRFFEQIPRDLLENIAYRREVYRRCQSSAKDRGLVMEMCRRDFFFWVDTFVWQFNPDHFGQEVGPWITFPWQEDIVRKTMHRLFIERRSALWEKSRKMGGTWLAILIFVWLSLFHDWKQTLMISHMAEAVDRTDDKDTLFWKIRFVIEHLPGWMQRGANKQKLGIFVFPATNSTISGAATTERSGVGGRGNVLLDEFSKHKKDYQILGQTAQTGPRLFIGTHYGISGAFYDLTRRPDQFKIVMHWTMHPEYRRGLYKADPDNPGRPLKLDKDYDYDPDYSFVLDGKPAGGPHPGIRSPWYDAQCEEMGNERDVAMHLDINPAGSTTQFFNPIMIANLVKKYTSDPVWVGDVQYDQWTGEFKGLQENPAGRLRLWILPDGYGRLPAAIYTAGADISAGVGNTCSTFTGIDAMKGRKILEYANPNLDPKQFAPLTVALCWLMSDKDKRGAKFAWECAGAVGSSFTKTMIENGYPHIYMRKKIFTVNGIDTMEPGWYPGGGCKRALLDDYVYALNNGLLLNPSESSLLECLKFQYGKGDEIEHGESVNTSDPSAGRANHGDQVMADALAWMLAKDLGAAKPGGQPQEPQEYGFGTIGWMEQEIEKHDKQVNRWSSTARMRG